MSKPELSPRKKGLQDRAKDTVNYIIEATTQLLEEKGAKGFTTNKIVERAGISIGTLYQYFPNKESILQQLIERVFTGATDDMVATIQSLQLEGIDLKSAVDKLMEHLFSNLEKKRSIFKQFLMSVVSVEHLKFMLKNDEKIVAALKDKFMPYAHELKVQNWDHTIFIILYALKGIQFGMMFGNTPFEQEQMRQEVSKLIYQYLKA